VTRFNEWFWMIICLTIFLCGLLILFHILRQIFNKNRQTAEMFFKETTLGIVFFVILVTGAAMYSVLSSLVSLGFIR
jgi:hypothetical protein